MDKKKIYTESMIFLAPSAKIKLAPKSGDVMSLQKQMCFIFLSSYNKFIEYNKYNKEHMAGMLSEKISVDP